jgi:hypothetical protein
MKLKDITHWSERSLKLSYALLLVSSQTITPITRMTRSTPVQTPALKISPIASQPVRARVERLKSATKRYEECFIGIPPVAVGTLNCDGRPRPAEESAYTHLSDLHFYVVE